MTIHKTINYGIAWADVDTPAVQLADVSQQAAETIDAALGRGGIAPPDATTQAQLAARATALEGRATTLEAGGALPIVALRATASQSLGAGWTSLTWGAEDFDPDDLHSTTVNPSRVTIKRKGLYRLDASVPFTLPAASYTGLRWIKNGVTTPPNGGTAWRQLVANTGDTIRANPLTLTLVPGDYIELQAGLTGAAAPTAWSATGDSLGAVLTIECKRTLP